MQSANASELTTDIAVIGGGAAGIGVIASLLKRSPGLRISLIEPADTHYYQPGWTLVGGGAYAQGDTARPMAGLVPPGVEWLRTRVERVDPEARRLLLESGGSLEYRNLIVCPGLRLAWERIEGLEETLGRNGVTSNYRYDLAPYTWELVRGLRGGKALFTQPAMPIKCAGAPQKAMYLSCDHWLREGVLQDIEVEFDLAGAALFGVADFVPPLMEYVRKYSAELAFNSNLVKVDGAARKAWFEVKDADGNTKLAEKDFDLLHVVPPQLPPTFVAASGLGDAAGWCEVDPATLQHVRHGEIFALGDVCGTANAKTAAAARKQIVVVAENLLGLRSGRGLPLRYDG
ncbi:NAD(P)/FAD-dependent oxidoreductase, partial [Pseudomonas aeruginosa]